MDAKENNSDKDKSQGRSGLGVSVVVPTLNETSNIDSLLEAILAESGNDLVLEILVADGGSADGTSEKVRAWESRAPVRLLSYGSTGSLASDVLAAGEAARYEIVVVMDADFS